MPGWWRRWLALLETSNLLSKALVLFYIANCSRSRWVSPWWRIVTWVCQAQRAKQFNSSSLPHCQNVSNSVPKSQLPCHWGPWPASHTPEPVSPVSEGSHTAWQASLADAVVVQPITAIYTLCCLLVLTPEAAQLPQQLLLPKQQEQQKQKTISLRLVTIVRKHVCWLPPSPCRKW